MTMELQDELFRLMVTLFAFCATMVPHDAVQLEAEQGERVKLAVDPAVMVSLPSNVQDCEEATWAQPFVSKIKQPAIYRNNLCRRHFMG
jgi:hypothetical protein